MTEQADNGRSYEISKYTGEFANRETEKKYLDIIWPVLSRRLIIALALCAANYLIANNAVRPGEYPEYRTIVIPLTKALAIAFLAAAALVWKSRRYAAPIRVLIALSEIGIGLLQAIDHYYFLIFRKEFYDIGTSFIVFYILIFYIVIPNKIKLTIFSNLAISIAFIIITHLSGTTAPSDLFSISIYFIIANALGYGILLSNNKSRREEYRQGILLKKAEAEARKARLLAEEANSARGRFLAVINHEMRTPLNVVLGGIQILSSDGGSAKHKEVLSMVRSSGEILKVLIQNVLDFTNIEKNKLKIINSRFSLVEMITEINQIYSRACEEKGLAFSIVNKCGPIDYLAGDSPRLRQILTNLLDNAVKFTKLGSVTLSVRALEMTGNSVLLRFEISDTGIGIPENRFEDILKPFGQVEQSAAGNFEGSGLGLAICRELLNAMNSRLEITSAVGAGSVFAFNLSLTHENQQLNNEAEDEIDSCRILLIDDNEANLKITSGLLETLDQKVICAQGGRQGIEKCRLEEFDALFIDLHMPEMDGLETFKEIKKTNPEAAAFLLTADSREEVFSKYKEAGFAGLIPKPIDIGQLKEALRKIKSGQSAINRDLKIDLSGDMIIDNDYIKELINDLGEDVFTDVIKTCLRTLEEGLQKTKQPQGIIDIREFMHQLSGVAGNYRLIRLWKTLEQYKSGRSPFDNDKLADILEETIEELGKKLTDVGPYR